MVARRLGVLDTDAAVVRLDRVTQEVERFLCRSRLQGLVGRDQVGLVRPLTFAETSVHEVVENGLGCASRFHRASVVHGWRSAQKYPLIRLSFGLFVPYGGGVHRAAVGLLTILLLATVFPSIATAQGTPRDIDAVNEALGVGVNLGNALEAPREGDWGLTLRAEYFELIAEAGFAHVRVPIKFSAYADAAAPYAIAEADATVVNASSLWERIDWVIAQAEANGLYVILDLHHYDELHDDPAGHRDRFLAIWDQVATRYADAGPLVLFELLNEPNAAFDVDRQVLNELLSDALAVVRATNPIRPVLVGPGAFNGIGALNDLVLPPDPNLIVSVHFYDPFPFTHQGAEWTEPVPPAPATWDAENLDLGAGWQNWSWDTTLAFGAETVTAEFDRQWAGLQFAHPSSDFDPVSLRVEILGSEGHELALRCGRIDPNDDAEDVDIATLTLDQVGGIDLFDLATCPDDTNRIVFMNASPDGAPINVTTAEICLSDGRCDRIVETGAQVVVSRFDDAARWALENGRPLNVGEFGAFSAGGLADLDERVEWTTAVRRAARSHGMSMSYWEFGAGFGVYDPVAGAWVQPLVDALLVDEGPSRIPTGDVNCDGRVDIVDALLIAQYVVGVRGERDACPLVDQATELVVPMGDVDRNLMLDIVDAMLIARCVAGVSEVVCPGG